MRCSGCGKDIPFGWQVCPHCQRDKSSDQASTVAGMIAMVVGGFIGNLVGGFGGMIIGAVVLGFIAVVMTLPGKKHSSRKAPAVRVVDANASPKPKITNSTADRLANLNALKEQGLLTEGEYERQRAVIIAAL